MRRLGLTVLLFLVLNTLPPVSAGYVSETRELTIVAVTPLSNGTYAGASAKLAARVVCPGRGGVYVETLPLSQIDLQASTRIAAIVASRIAGIRFASCDFLASIKAESPIVGGPSASAATAVAFSAALLGLSLRADVVLTGMILPDGSIGPVGGLRAKLEAAAWVGAKVFLVPLGQTRYTETVTVPQTIGPVTVYVTRPIVVDLVEYGRKLGVDVIPVATIHDALRIFTDGAYSAPESGREGLATANLTPAVEQQVRSWSEALLGMVEESMVSGDSIKDRALSSLPRSLKAYVESLVYDIENRVSTLTSRAGDLYRRGYLYSAASTYFQALVYSLRRLYLLRGLRNAEDLDNIRRDIESRADHVLQRVRGRLAEDGVLCLQDLDVYITTINRVYEALIHLNRSSSESRIDGLTYYLALAGSRVATAELWSSLLRVESGGGERCCPLSAKYAEDSTIVLENLVYNIYAYIISFEGQVNIPSEVFNEMVARMNLMKDATAPIDRLSLGIEALAYGYATLVGMFSQDINSTIAALGRAISVELTSESLSKCLPTSLMLYLELAETQEESAFSKAYTLARISALISFYVDSLREATFLRDTTRPMPTTEVNEVKIATITQTVACTVTLTNTLVRGVDPLARIEYVGLGLLLGLFIAFASVVLIGKRRPAST